MGMGSELVYYLNVLNRPQPAETTLRRVVAAPRSIGCRLRAVLTLQEPKTER